LNAVNAVADTRSIVRRTAAVSDGRASGRDKTHWSPHWSSRGSPIGLLLATLPSLQRDTSLSCPGALFREPEPTRSSPIPGCHQGWSDRPLAGWIVADFRLTLLGRGSRAVGQRQGANGATPPRRRAPGCRPRPGEREGFVETRPLRRSEGTRRSPGRGIGLGIWPAMTQPQHPANQLVLSPVTFA
jgi:hypothetical protein